MDCQDFAPDDYLMMQLFPEDMHCPTVILAQNATECSFLATPTVSDYTPKGSPTQVVVRISLLNEKAPLLRSIAAISSVAALVIPDLVPAVKRVGVAHTLDGRDAEFMITEFISEAVALQEIWDGLPDDDQQGIVAELVSAMTKLQSLRVCDPRVQEILCPLDASEREPCHTDGYTSTETPVLLGGPELGFYTNLRFLLQSIVYSQNDPSSPTSTIERKNDDTAIIRSIYPDIAPVYITYDDLADIRSCAVLCHNDLEPRNILVHPTMSNEGTHYTVVSIIDWELAAFVPFGYEYTLKDHLLGSSNLHYSWYSLFKVLTAGLQELDKEEKLMQVVNLVYESSHRGRTRNVGLVMRSKWIAREHLIRDPVVWKGWVREQGQEALQRYGAADNQKLLEETLVELGMV